MAHSLWMANGGAAINLDGQAITMTNGYPNRATVHFTLQTGSIDTVAPGTPGHFLYNTGNGQFRLVGANAQATCVVTYTAAAALGQSPTITTNTAGC
jgi:hypothetical protein